MKNILKFCFVALFFTIFSVAQVPPLTISQVDAAPVFVGGQSALNAFVSSNIVIPEVEGATGVIKVTFVIEIDGSLTNIKIIQNLGPEFETAANDVFKISPKWLPGEANGNKVRVLMEYPITIK